MTSSAPTAPNPMVSVDRRRSMFKFVCGAVLGVVIVATADFALAQLTHVNFLRGANAQPSNIIRIVVAGAPGGPPDVISRVIATDLAENDGWHVTVEDRPGALSTIAISDVLKQPADGRTVLLMDMSMTAAPALFPNMGLRMDTDFAPVIKLSRQYNVLVVSPSVPAKSVADLVGILKSQPDKFNFSSGPFGTPAHLMGELFKLKTGVHATLVPYPSPQQRMVDLLAGTVHFDFLNVAMAAELVSSGKLRALAVMAPTRLPVLREVSTAVEQGFPDLIVEDWVGFTVKSGTPDEKVARLNESVNTTLAKPKIQDALANLGAEPAGGTSAEFGIFIKSQVAHWGKVVTDSGIKMSH